METLVLLMNIVNPIIDIQWNDKREKAKVKEGATRVGRYSDQTERWACVDITFEDRSKLLLDFCCGHNGYYMHEVKIEFEGKEDTQGI